MFHRLSNSWYVASSGLTALIDAAKALLGSAIADAKLSTADVARLLTAKGTPFSVSEKNETTRGSSTRVKIRAASWWRSGLWEDIRPTRTETFHDLLVGGVVIPDGYEYVIDYRLIYRAGKAVLVPAVRMTPPEFRRATDTWPTPQAPEFVRGLFPEYELKIGEQVVMLPVPSWVTAQGGGSCGCGGDWASSAGLLATRSEAEALVREFAARPLAAADSE